MTAEGAPRVERDGDVVTLTMCRPAGDVGEVVPGAEHRPLRGDHQTGRVALPHSRHGAQQLSLIHI